MIVITEHTQREPEKLFVYDGDGNPVDLAWWNRKRSKAKLLKTERLEGTPVVDPIKGTNEA